MHKHMFVNLPIRDMKKSQAFFRSVGYEFNPQFTNDQGACLVAGENLFVMLLVTDFFKTFTGKPVADAHQSTEVLVALSCDSRAHVDELVAARVPPAAPCSPQDLGFMYSHGFEDLDGHVSGTGVHGAGRGCRRRHEGNKPSADAGAPDSPAALATHRAIEAVWRIEAASVIAGVARLVRDVGLAEELAQDALVAALERWPASGVPDNPGAWLMTTAKNRARDRLRLDALHSRKHEQIGHELRALEADVEPDFVDAGRRAPGRYRRRSAAADLHGLPSAAVHRGARGADAAAAGRPVDDRIARAFLASESTIAQRIVRAKRNLSAARVPFEVPARPSAPRGWPRCWKLST